jgi:hypothetical protein
MLCPVPAEQSLSMLAGDKNAAQAEAGKLGMTELLSRYTRSLKTHVANRVNGIVLFWFLIKRCKYLMSLLHKFPLSTVIICM